MKKILIICTAVILTVSVGVASFAAGRSLFNDVNPDDYYYDAVNWAVSNGITDGTSESTFSPNNACTRGQVVTFLYRSLKDKTEELERLKNTVSTMSKKISALESGTVYTPGSGDVQISEPNAVNVPPMEVLNEPVIPEKLINISSPSIYKATNGMYYTYNPFEDINEPIKSIGWTTAENSEFILENDRIYTAAEGNVLLLVVFNCYSNYIGVTIDQEAFFFYIEYDGIKYHPLDMMLSRSSKMVYVNDTISGKAGSSAMVEGPISSSTDNNSEIYLVIEVPESLLTVFYSRDYKLNYYYNTLDYDGLRYHRVNGLRGDSIVSYPLS